ncbi:MAG: UDP-N-acetylmuramoyl-L-alanyl-D-glutamate--2,6-diaminopimelate ligase [Ignavibacteria bacterium]
MRFSEMVNKATELRNEITVLNDFEVSGLCYNSKIVQSGDVFFAIKGYKTDGNRYIPDALARGAQAVITDDAGIAKTDKIYHVGDCRKAMAELSNSLYDFPSRKMIITGVTGTNGKTTVTGIINYVLEQSGRKTGLIGTNGNVINKKKIETGHTTPESVDLNSLLNEMSEAGVEYVTMEVSSHALELKRVYGIDFDIAVFTNLTPEHLDFHNSIENYFSAKKILFDSIPRINSKNKNTYVIYNSDDEYGEKIVSGAEPERISFGFNCALYSVKNLSMSFDGMSFEMLVPFNGEGIDRMEVESTLTGRFNVYNILAATAALKSLGIKYSEINKSLRSFTAVDGRFNRVKLNNGAIAIIDYSHTPDSLSKAISTIREILNLNNSVGRIITVFGCGGNRDRSKRPVMGKIATVLSDHAIITSDNPRDEEPMDIIEEIKSGITSDNYSVTEDREKAINESVAMAKKGDVILVAGKGHETYQEIKGVKYHLSDREIVEKFM